MSNTNYTSVQEAALEFANTIASVVNAAAAETAGIDVLWFRAMPDKRSQDVIFQSYTLYGVEDCPLSFKAVYTDTGYDDAAITYNIMGLEYSVPLTLEIAVQTWKDVTNNDGTIPQRGDIVFIPTSRKLVEVVSMTPVKAIGAQLTSYKVNCSIYKPTRSRLVGDNLKTSIEENTVNLKSLFGDDIKNTFENVIDDNQLSMFNSTQKDLHKKITPNNTINSTIDQPIANIVSHELLIDGHLVARSYYDMNVTQNPVVAYNKIDTIDASSNRTYSCWFLIESEDDCKNIKSFTTDIDVLERVLDGKKEVIQRPKGENIYIKEYSGKRFAAGTHVIIERGNVVICGEVLDTSVYTIKTNLSVIRALNKNVKNWNNLPGYTIREDNIVNFLYANGETNMYEISLHANRIISFNLNGTSLLVQSPIKLKTNKWYGIIINYGENIGVSIFESEPELKQICNISGIKNNANISGTYSYSINKSNAKMTNIRLYNVANTEIDKQITDLLSFNTPYNSLAIINDSVDIPLNKPFVGQQR
jgi:hypothetical protein